MGVINFGEIFQNELEKFVKNIKKPNILVLGGSGVGKSTLVNLVLKREVAIPGSGKPETKGIITYPNDVITIHDSEGYESGEEKQAYYKKLIGDFIEKKSLKAEDSIHLAWYCISAPSARVN
ncbi:MAG: 50S ribosome-binding GTPase, partial [Mailhella sp.]|nr:50S ribosome-binding GTPase [Mailhella sp.]